MKDTGVLFIDKAIGDMFHYYTDLAKQYGHMKLMTLYFKGEDDIANAEDVDAVNKALENIKKQMADAVVVDA